MSSQLAAPTVAPKTPQAPAPQHQRGPQAPSRLRGSWLRDVNSSLSDSSTGASDSSPPPLQGQSLLELPLFPSQQPQPQPQSQSQTKTVPTSAPIHSGLETSLMRGLNSPSDGPNLPELARIQQSFGPFDLSTVRIHRGQQAQDCAQQLSAHAFSHGEHIVAPGTPSLRLLAHEAAHTIQQRQPGLVQAGISQASDWGEHHADAIADRVVAGLSSVDLLTQVAPQGMHATGLDPGGALQRTPADRTPERRISIALDSLDTFFSRDAQQADLPSWQQVKPLIQSWQGDSQKADERIRIGAALHLGTSGNASTRILRRAILLIRTAVLRNDLDKAKTETLALGDASLSTTLKRVVAAAANRPNLLLKRFQYEKLANEAATATNELTGISTAINKQYHASRHAFYKEHGYGSHTVEAKWPEEVKLKLKNKIDSDLQDLQQKQTEQSAKVQAAQKRADDYNQSQRANKPQLIFNPSKEEDNAMINNRKYLNLKEINVGSSGLGVLTAGGELYIVGHGNFGNGVGGHHDHKTPEAMVAALVASGLPKKPKAPVDLYVWACWGSVRTQRERVQQPRQRRQPNLTYNEPYARRLAQTLFQQGFKNYNVIGFAGTVNASNLYQRLLYDPDTKAEYNSSEVEYAQAHSIYAVGDDSWDRVVGEDWNATLTASGTREEYLVSKRGPR